MATYDVAKALVRLVENAPADGPFHDARITFWAGSTGFTVETREGEAFYIDVHLAEHSE
jgi:hypothetical protein